MQARFELSVQDLMDFPGSSNPRLASEGLRDQNNSVMGFPGLGRAHSMSVTGMPITLIDNFQMRRFERSEESVTNSFISAGHNWYAPVTF